MKKPSLLPGNFIPTYAVEPWYPVEKIVVIFDIASSSSLLAELTRVQKVNVFLGQIDRFPSFFWQEFKEFFPKMEEAFKTEPSEFFYKFTGDGGVLVFPLDFDAEKILSFLQHLSRKFDQWFLYTAADIWRDTNLETSQLDLTRVRLTFGISHGTLFKMGMLFHGEYIGLPICVAARLQQKTKLFERTSMLIAKETADQFFPAGLTEKYSATNEHLDLEIIGLDKAAVLRVPYNPGDLSVTKWLERDWELSRDQPERKDYLAKKTM